MQILQLVDHSLYRYTSAEEVVFCPAFVCLSVCFCLLATSQKTTDRSFTKIYQIYLYLDKEELTKSWKKSASGSGSRNFKGFFNIAGGHFFHNLSHIHGRPA